MEELRSTDVLDKEIAADARKKASRILQRADDEGAALLAAVDGRVDAARKEIETSVNSRVASYKKNTQASVPLEKERFRVSFVQKAMNDAMRAYVDGCGKDKLLSFVIARYKKCHAELGNKTLRVQVVALDEKAAKKALEELGAQIESVEYLASDDAMDAGLILMGENVLARLTVAQIMDELEDEKRAELSASLLGELKGREA